MRPIDSPLCKVGLVLSVLRPKTPRRSRHIATLCLLGLIAGCGDGNSRGASNEFRSGEVNVELPSGEIIRVLPKQSLVILPSGEELRATAGEATVGESLVLMAKDGTVSAHRKPDIVSQELVRLPTLYLRADTLERVVAESGYESNAFVDPATGQLCWIALTCNNAACASAGPDGGPVLFLWPEAGVSLGQNGQVVRSLAPSNGWPTCPHCGGQKTVEKFELPEVVSRRGKLEAELRRVRDARDAIARDRAQ